MGLIIGMDEAGYGPNLGPLVVTATVWEVPGLPHETDLWAQMAEAVHPAPRAGDGRLQIGDSKAVYSPARGLAALERSVLAAFSLWGHSPGGFQELRRLLSGGTPATVDEGEPWFNGCDLALPHAPHGDVAAGPKRCLEPPEGRRSGGAKRERRPSVPPPFGPSVPPAPRPGPAIDEAVGRWQDCCARYGIRLRAIRSELVLTGRFNRLLRECGNKAAALTRTGLALLREVWDADSAEPALIVADKHGGRNRYDIALTEALGRLVLRHQEGRELSRYTVGAAEICFEPRAESHLPVALASMVSKYVRELAMELFNRYWCRQVPGLKPTKGYPLDAARFRREIAAARQRLGIPDEHLWRER